MPEQYKTKYGMTAEEYAQTEPWVQKHYEHYKTMPTTYMSEWLSTKRKTQLIKPVPTAKDTVSYPVTNKYGVPLPSGQTVKFKRGSPAEQSHIKSEAVKEPKKPVKLTEAEFKRKQKAERTPEEVYKARVDKEIARLGKVGTVRRGFQPDSTQFAEQIEVLDAEILGITQNLYDAKDALRKTQGKLSQKKTADLIKIYDAVEQHLGQGGSPEGIEASLKKNYNMTIEELSQLYKANQ